MRRLVAGICGVLVLGCLFAVCVGWLLSRPVPARVGPPPEDLAAQSVSFKSATGTVVHAWLSQSPDSRGAVILLPGVRANRLSMVDRARFLRHAGYTVLLIDLQATGETAGTMITFGWRERLDVIAAVDFLRRTSSPRIAILGTSLGGAAALFASKDVAVDALVLESVYPSIEQATKNRLRIYLGRIGALASPLLLAQLRPRLGLSADELRPIDYVQFVRCPVFIMGGARDRHTTESETLALFAAARPPKIVWIVPNASHVDLHRAARAEYEQRVLRFLDDHLRQFGV